MEKYNFDGIHLVAEYYGIDFEYLGNFNRVKEVLNEAMELAGVTCVGIIEKEFEPLGYTIVAALLESHISIHAYPEHKAMFIDIFTCGEKDPMIINDLLIKKLKIKKYDIEVIKRGNIERYKEVKENINE